MSHERQRWRYHVLRTQAPIPAGDLDALGEDGWELVAAIPEPGTTAVNLIFKRPAPTFRERITLDQRAAVTGAEDGSQ